MVEWALKPLKAFALLTRQCFVNERVELLLLPPMTVRTCVQSLASFLVASDESATLPILTELSFIAEEVRLASKVLEVMRIHALSFVVVVVEGAPLSLEEENIKFIVLILGLHMMNQPNFDIFHRMSEGAIVPILALLNFIRIEVAEFCLVFIFVVQSLNSIVCSSAFVFLWAFFCIGKLAEFWRIQVIISSAVFYRVIVVA
jgi:hypothetical protein